MECRCRWIRSRKSKTTIAPYSASWRATLQPTDCGCPAHRRDSPGNVLFCFSFLFFSSVFRDGSNYHSSFLFFQIFSFTFYYVFLNRNSLDKDFRNILLKNYIEHCAYKLYDELVRKKLSETSSWLHFHRSCVENLSWQVIFLQVV